HTVPYHAIHAIEYLPNFGPSTKPSFSHDLSWIYKDPDEDLDVDLIITRSTRDITEPHDHHWKLSWIVAETRKNTLFAWQMSLRTRQELEAVAAVEPVRVPDGQWNCQDWLISVLERAEALEILTHEQWWPACS
ncbi:hypothetical protein CPB85DRAFT_1342533, partial [Mucidula mucida]